jgi:hypothetical protein
MRRRSTGITGSVAVFAVAMLVVAVAGQAGGPPSDPGSPPSLDWTPSTAGSFGFGLVGVGKTATQTFTLTNSGGSASAALTVTLTDAPGLSITEDDCTGTSLGPAKSCTVTVEYAPTTSGSTSATLNASGKKAAATADLTVTGSAALMFVADGPAVPGLSGLNENPPHPESSATGTTTVFWDTTTSTMTVNVVFDGLTTPNTAAHIHCCVSAPGNAGVATTVPTYTGFPGGVTSGTYTHTFNMLDASSWNPAFVSAQGGVANAVSALLAGLQAGRAYQNVHTQRFAGGEIRGFLHPA